VRYDIIRARSQLHNNNTDKQLQIVIHDDLKQQRGVPAGLTKATEMKGTISKYRTYNGKVVVKILGT